MAGRLEERDACGKHGGVIAAEVVGKEKEADPPAGLIADCGALPFALGPGEQESGLRRTFGRTTTQRLPPPRSLSSRRSKPSLPQ